METLTATTRKERAQEVFALIPDIFREKFEIRMECSDYKGYETHSLIVDKCNFTFGNPHCLFVSVAKNSICIKNDEGVYLNLYLFDSGTHFYNIMAL